MGAEAPAEAMPPPSPEEIKKGQIEKAAESRAVKSVFKDLENASDEDGKLTQKEKRAFNRAEMKASRKAERQDGRAERFDDKSGKKAEEKEQLAKDKTALLKKMEEASREQEDNPKLKKLEEELLHADDPPAPDKGTEDKKNEKKPELVESMASKWETVLKGLALDLADHAPDKNDTFGKFSYGLKGGLFRLLVAFSGSDATKWAENLSTEQRQVLQDALGLKLVPGKDDKENAILTVEWIDPLPDYQPPSKRIVAVFEKHLGKSAADLKTAFDTIKPDMKLGALKTVVSTMTHAEQKAEYEAFIAAMEAQGIKDDEVVMDAIKGEKGSKLLTEEENKKVEAESTPKEGELITLVNKTYLPNGAKTTVGEFLKASKTVVDRYAKEQKDTTWQALGDQLPSLFKGYDNNKLLSESIEELNAIKSNTALRDAIKKNLVLAETAKQIGIKSITDGLNFEHGKDTTVKEFSDAIKNSKIYTGNSQELKDGFDAILEEMEVKQPEVSNKKLLDIITTDPRVKEDTEYADFYAAIKAKLKETPASAEPVPAVTPPQPNTPSTAIPRNSDTLHPQ